MDQSVRAAILNTFQTAFPGVDASRLEMRDGADPVGIVVLDWPHDRKLRVEAFASGHVELTNGNPSRPYRGPILTGTAADVRAALLTELRLIGQMIGVDVFDQSTPIFADYDIDRDEEQAEQEARS